MPAGYSATPLFKKLGLKEGFYVKAVNKPVQYKNLLGDITATLHFSNTATTDLDVIHFFTNSVKEYQTELPRLMQQIKKNGAIWVSWYKKSPGKSTELTEEIIRNTALAAGLVDVKVCAVDEEWSGLKLVYRLQDR